MFCAWGLIIFPNVTCLFRMIIRLPVVVCLRIRICMFVFIFVCMVIYLCISVSVSGVKHR